MRLYDFHLSLGRFFSKFLVLFFFFLVSPDFFWGCIAILFLSVMEFLFFRRFESNTGKFSVILFSSVFSYTIPLFIKSGTIFIIFFVTDLISLISFYLRAFALIAVLPGFLFFFSVLPPLFITRDVVNGKIKPYVENDEKIDFIRVDIDKEEVGKMKFGGRFWANFVHNGETFVFRLKVFQDREILVLSILSVFSSFYISLYIFRRSQMGGKKGYGEKEEPEVFEPEKKDEYREALVNYLRKMFDKLEESKAADIENIQKYKNEVSKFVSRWDYVSKNAYDKLQEIESFLSECKERFSAAKFNISGDISSIISTLEDILGISKDILSHISVLKHKIAFYRESLGRDFSNVEFLFHEIFSPLGGMENLIGKAKLRVSDRHIDVHLIFEKFGNLYGALKEFIGNIKDLHESFHILHLNSQVRAYKIRDVVPEFEVIPRAINMTLQKMEEIINNIEEEMKVLDIFFQYFRDMNSSSFLEIDFEQLSKSVSDMKSSLENLMSFLNSVYLNFMNSIERVYNDISRFEKNLREFMEIIYETLHSVYNLTSSLDRSFSRLNYAREKILGVISSILEGGSKK